jgi:hypothetical protein
MAKYLVPNQTPRHIVARLHEYTALYQEVFDADTPWIIRRQIALVDADWNIVGTATLDDPPDEAMLKYACHRIEILKSLQAIGHHTPASTTTIR